MTNFRQEVKRNMQILNKNLINVKKEVEKLQGAEGVIEKVAVKQAEKPEPVLSRVPIVTPQTEFEKEIPESAKKTAPLKPEFVEKPILSKPLITQMEKPATDTQTAANRADSDIKTTIPKPTTPKPRRDYEKLIGENWLNKIGIAILVIGIGFFVKYAIDQNWIGEIGRAGIGLAVGGLLVSIAHFMRKKYRAFSSVLIGGGISVFYYTISIAYHDYHLFNQQTAFVIMVGITLFSTIMAVLYDRKELAVIALIGAFTSPLMVRGETGNYIVFFTYIAIINSGMLLLSYFKKWPIINKLALGFTVLFFGTWAIIADLSPAKPGGWALAFSSLFFIQFLGMNLVHNFVRKIKFNAWEFIQLTSITALFYGTALYIVSTHNFGITSGGLTIALSLFYTALALFAKLRAGTDKALIYLLIGKAITFITITPLLLFEGNYMTLFWSIEAVVILFLGQYANMRILKNASIILTFIGLFGLAKDWVNTYAQFQSILTPFANGTFLTGIFSVITLISTFILVKREKDENAFFIHNRQYHFALGTLIFAIGYLTLLFELTFQLNYLNFTEGEKLVLWLFHLILIILGLVIAHIRKSDLMGQIFFFISCVATVTYLIFGQENNYGILFENFRSAGKETYYYLHFLQTACVIAILMLLKRSIAKITENKEAINAFTAVIAIIGLILATVELDQILGFGYGNQYGLTKVFSHARTEGYTILWGLYSFILMIWGMKKQIRMIRILALVLFSVTLLKLFLFDIQHITEAGKIVAFISLGVLLLVVSFLYQKLKAIIVDGKIE